MSEELRPCPFCGEKATLDYSVLPNRKHWFITCDCCGMMYQYTLSQRKYVKDGWNTRPIEDALNARIAELEAERRWIPVSERLPELGSPILFYDSILERINKGTCTAKNSDNTNLHWFTDDDLFYFGDRSEYITHWMPLPNPPEVK